MRKFVAWTALLFLAGALACAAQEMPPAPQTPGLTPPREVRTGAVDSVLQAVETNVSRDEVALAVAYLVAHKAVCLNWPTLWLEQSNRRELFRVRYDLMARDWGENIAQTSRARMEEYVAMGFLQRRPREDLGPGAVDYVLTRAGDAALSGSPYSGERPTFCLQSERRLTDVVSMEWIRSDCGNLRVRFRHVSDAWPTWAVSDTTRQRLSEQWPPLGEPAEGEVTLSRQWFSRRALPPDTPNGALRSVCYDQQRARVIGDDIVLFAAPTETAPY